VVPPPSFLGLGLGTHADFPGWNGHLPSPGFGFLCLVIVVGCGALVAALRRSAVGQQMLAVRPTSVRPQPRLTLAGPSSPARVMTASRRPNKIVPRLERGSQTASAGLEER